MTQLTILALAFVVFMAYPCAAWWLRWQLDMCNSPGSQKTVFERLLVSVVIWLFVGMALMQLHLLLGLHYMSSMLQQSTWEGS